MKIIVRVIGSLTGRSLGELVGNSAFCSSDYSVRANEGGETACGMAHRETRRKGLRHCWRKSSTTDEHECPKQRKRPSKERNNRKARVYT